MDIILNIICDNVVIPPNYYDTDINVKVLKVFKLSPDFHVDKGMNVICDTYIINNIFSPIDYVLYEIIEGKFLEIEEIIAKCEITLDRIKIINKICLYLLYSKLYYYL
jgi:hypothetical protein